MQINGITVVADPGLHKEEVELLVAQEAEEWGALGKEIAGITLELEGDEVLIHATEKSPIRRVRRITGYLSNIENFNPAKKAECQDRYAHAVDFSA